MLNTTHALVLLGGLAAACAPSPPLADWDDAALCPRGATPLPLIPRPRSLTSDAAPYVPSARTVRVRSGSLELPAIAALARAAKATIVAPDDDSAGLSLLVLGDDAVDEITQRCGVPLPADNAEAYHLVTAEDRALIAARTPRGRARAAALVAELWTDALPQVHAADWPEQPLRGVLEGSYGPAWSPEERAEMLDFTWRARMNTLVWAPKAELLSRIFWRANYSGELLQHLRDLAAEAALLEVDLCAELSPGNGILYSDPAERAIIVAKLDRLAELGVGCLALAFDDIPRELRPEDQPHYPGGIGEAHAELAAAVFAELAAHHPGIRLGFVPVDYSTAAMRAHPEYTRAVAMRLQRDVFLGWTGVEIVSSTVSAGDVDEVTALWGRAPLMGDNYPVTDSSRDAGHLQLGPVVGRDAEAIRRTEGWIANSMPLPLASTIPLSTIADQLWDPARYQPEDAWHRALAKAAPDPAARAALERFAAHARSSALDPREAEEGAALVEAWLADARVGQAPLEVYLDALVGLPEALAPLGALAAEVQPWSAQLAGYGRAGRELLALTEMQARGEVPPPARIDALRGASEQLAESPARIAGGVLDGMLARGRARLER